MDMETAASRAFLADLAPVEDAAWDEVETASGRRPRLSAEFWTSRQRQAANLHEISYRACYKPQLPRHFIERLTLPGERVYDPFSGRAPPPWRRPSWGAGWPPMT